jgi:hypothetical protein
MMRQGWLMSLFHASRQGSAMSSKDLKVRFDSQLSGKNCQMFSCGFSSGRCRERDQRDVGWRDEPARQMPAGLIDQHHGMRFRRDLGGDFGEMEGHRLGVALGHDQADRLAFFRADRAEDVGRGGARVARRRRPRSALCRTSGDLVLRADPGPCRSFSADSGIVAGAVGAGDRKPSGTPSPWMSLSLRLPFHRTRTVAWAALSEARLRKHGIG